MSGTAPDIAAVDVSGRCARVVVDVGPAHLDRPFDYLIEGPDGPPALPVVVGTQVRVSFNGRPRTAWVTGTHDTPATEPARMKPIDRVEGPTVWFDEDDLRAWRWIADRFAGTLSGVIRHALPKRIVRVETEAAGWGPTGAGPLSPLALPARLDASDLWDEVDAGGLLRAVSQPDGSVHHLRVPMSPLGEGPVLADLVARCIERGRQAVVVAPSAAPGPADDVIAAVGNAGVDLRGEHSDADRYRAFLRLRRGEIGVVVGERSVALLPLPSLGLLIVLDEANPAYKERRNPRHHVREAVLGRARISGAVAVMTSSVVSAQTRRHLLGGHINKVRASRTDERAAAPAVQVVNRSELSPSARRSRLTAPVARQMDRVIAAGGRIIVLAAAKGSGSSLACVRCRSRRECPTCGAGVAARGIAEWACGSCGWTGPPRSCLDCDAHETFPLRAGAKRLASELAKTHPEASVVHMEGFDQPGPTTSPAIAVMTRGSIVDRPAWLTAENGVVGLADLLVIADSDVLIGRPDMGAAEDAARLWLDASRLARSIIIQTTEPDHPAVQAVVRQDGDGFWDGEQPRREVLGFPPAGSLLRFTSLPPDQAAQIKRDVPGTVLGPDPNGVALLKTQDLRATLDALRPHRIEWAKADIRIRVDVDPVNLGT